MYYTGLTVILLAMAIGGSCNSCAYPTKSDMEPVIENILEFGHAEHGDLNIEILILHPVCLAVSNVPNQYQAASVWVRYTCTGDDDICPSGIVEEQFESDCDNGVWSVEGDTVNTRTENPTAKYATTTKRNCYNCLSPERAVGVEPDGTTHCLECDSSCTSGGGLMGCTTSSSTSCCNFYDHSVCVQTCPANHVFDDITFECGCPVGFTGDDCQIPVDCGTTGLAIEHGEFTSRQSTLHASVTYTCDIGYTLVGNVERVCQSDGTWSGTRPECLVNMCPALSAPANGAVNTAGLTFGSTATYTCNANYFPTGDTVRTCMANRAWSGTEPTCTLGDCEQPPSILNGVVVAPILKFTFNATYTCNTGYHLVGVAVIFCVDDASGDNRGVWDRGAPSCVLDDCGSLTQPVNGMVTTTDGATTYNSMATYTCVTGYNLNGNAMRTCVAGGVWSGSDPTCIIADCGPAPAPLNGSTLVGLTSGTTYNSKANYTCDENLIYKSGDFLLICEASGVWSGTQLLCERMPTMSPTATTTGGQCIRQSLVIVVVFLLLSIFFL